MRSLSLLCVVALTSTAFAGKGWLDWFKSESACDGKWSDWEQTEKCVWPGVFTKADAPKACMSLPPKPAKMPELPYKLLEAKHDDYFNRWQVQLKDRGIGDKPCGMCGFKMKCRQVADAPTNMNCPVKEKIFVMDSECQSEDVCELTQKDGGCDGPELLDMMHFMSVMSAMGKPGKHQEDMEYGMKVEQFMAMMMGAPSMGKGMMMGGMFGGKGKKKKWGSSSSSMSGESSSMSKSSEEGNDVKKQLDGLIQTLSGQNKDQVLNTIKTMMSQDGPAADKIRETLQAFKNLFNRRRKKRQADSDLADNETYLAPKVNCVPNKANDGCVCCCDWHIPDRETNKCVNIRESMIEFIKAFDPMENSSSSEE